MQQIARAVPAVLLAVFCTATPATAAPIPYTYTLIAESNPLAGSALALTGVGISAGINDDGTVAFVGALRAGGTAIFTGSGGALTSVAASGSTFSGFSQVPAINDAGRVAFEATLTAGGAGVFTAGGGGPLTTIAQGAGGLANFGFNASLNNAGTVVFATGNGLMTGSGGALTTALASSATVQNLGSTVPDISDSGAIAFAARINNRAGIFRVETGIVTTISDETGPFSAFYSTNPSINATGTVAFGGILDAGFPNQRATATGAGGAVTTIANSAGALNNNMSNPVINDAGKVVFWSGLDAVGAGIFTGDDVVDDAVIKTGQSLFGSTVSGLTFQGGDGFNDFGDVAFIATLADNRRVVVRANAPREPLAVPEPGAGVVAFALAAWLACRRRAAR